MPTLFPVAMPIDFNDPHYWPEDFVDNVPPLRPPFSPELGEILRETRTRFRAKELGISVWRTHDLKELRLLMQDRERRLAHGNTARYIGVAPEDFSAGALSEAFSMHARSLCKGLMFCEEPGEPLLSMHECRMAFEELQRRQSKNHNDGGHVEIIYPRD